MWFRKTHYKEITFWLSQNRCGKDKDTMEGIMKTTGSVYAYSCC